MHVEVAGGWVCLYRAVDSAVKTIEFLLSPKRDLLKRPVNSVDVVAAETTLPSRTIASKEAHCRKLRNPIGGGYMSNDRRLRGDACNSQGQIRVAKGDPVAHRQFIHTIFASPRSSHRECTSSPPRSRYLQTAPATSRPASSSGSHRRRSTCSIPFGLAISRRPDKSQIPRW